MSAATPALYDGVARTPAMRVEEACAWIAEDYPRRWLRLVNLCEWAGGRGWPRIRRGDLVARTPAMRVEEACAWIAEDYPRRWLRLVNLCEWAGGRGWPRIRRGDLFVLAAQQGLPISECREFRFDNNLWSVLSRYLIMFRRDLAGVIFPREADVDQVDLESMWRDHVALSTRFEAATWQEAAEEVRAA